MTRHGIVEPRRRGRTAVAGARSLGWSEWGSEDAEPVLFCPGAGTSSLLGFGADVVDTLGIRLIAVDRPGLGASDPDPGRTLLDWARDVGALVAARGLDRPAIVGFSQGAPFALACAAAGLVRGTTLVSGGDELAAPHLAPELVPDVRALVERVARDPAGAEAMFRGMSPGAMHGMVVSMSGEVDRAVYADETFDATYRRALDEGFAQGPDGYARDTVLAMSPWPFDPGAITVPVELWYGSADTSPVHSPDLGESLARRIPTARRTVVEGAGGAILWTHAAAILASWATGRS